MYSRVTLLEIDTLRMGMEEAVELFREQVVPGLREQDGYEGVSPSLARRARDDRHLLGHGGGGAGHLRLRIRGARALRDAVPLAARA